MPVGRLHLITAMRREIEDVFLGLGFRVVEGPEIETVYYNFDALNHDAAAPRAAGDATRSTSPTTWCCARTRRRCRCARWSSQPPPLYIVVPGRTYRRDNDATHTPQFHQVEGLAVDEDITLADLQGTLLAFARAIFGDDRDVRLRPHFFPFTEPSVEFDVSCFNCTDGFLRDGSRCPLCKGTGWIEILGAGMVDPNVFGYVREHGYDPERVPGLRLRHGDRADRVPQARRPRPAADLRERPALPGAVRMRLSRCSGCTTTATPGSTPPTLAERLALTGTEVDRVHAHGVAALEHFVVGRVLTAERHPDADRLTRLHGRHRRRRRRRRSSAARRTSPPARPSRSRARAR